MGLNACLQPLPRQGKPASYPIASTQQVRCGQHRASPLPRRSIFHEAWAAGCRCTSSQELLKHHWRCISPECLTCVPVKQYIQTQRLAGHLQQQQQRAAAVAQDPALQQQLFQQQQALWQDAAAWQQQMMAGMMLVSTPRAGSGSRSLLHTQTKIYGPSNPVRAASE